MCRRVRKADIWWYVKSSSAANVRLQVKETFAQYEKHCMSSSLSGSLPREGLHMYDPNALLLETICNKPLVITEHYT